MPVTTRRRALAAILVAALAVPLFALLYAQEDKPPETCGILGAKAKHHDRCPFGEGFTYSSQSLRPNKRRVAEDHEYVVCGARDRGFRGQHRMSGPAPLRLHENLGIR